MKTCHFYYFGLVSFLPCLENCTHVSRTYGKRSFRTINISWFRSPSIYIIINAFCLWTSWKASKDLNFTWTIDEDFIGEWIEFTGWDDVLAAQPSVGSPNSQIFLYDHWWLMLRIPGRSGKRRKSSEIGFESWQKKARIKRKESFVLFECLEEFYLAGV